MVSKFQMTLASLSLSVLFSTVYINLNKQERVAFV